MEELKKYKELGWVILPLYGKSSFSQELGNRTTKI